MSDVEYQGYDDLTFDLATAADLRPTQYFDGTEHLKGPFFCWHDLF